MHAARKTFILTEAAATLPLVRVILRDIRDWRCRLSKVRRDALGRGADAERLMAGSALFRQLERKVADCLSEAERLGVRISDGVRCEALFPFEHRWVGPKGDGKLRLAWFAYNDASDTIDEWYFDGWPNDRRTVNPTWWHQFRRGQVLMRIRRQPTDAATRNPSSVPIPPPSNGRSAA
jgi:hypothetical protein